VNFLTRLKKLRKELGFSQDKISAELNVPQTTYSNWERGRNEPPLEVLSTFCERYNINLNWLLTGQGEMFFSSGGETTFNPTIIRAIDTLTRELQGVKQNLNPLLSQEERQRILASPPGAMKMVFPEKPTLMPLVNDIRCGSMATILSESTELIEVPPTWKSKGDFCVKIKGNSMRLEGIIEGMIVLIRKKPVPDSGDIILVYGYDTPDEVNGVLKKAKYLDDGTLILQNASGETLDMGEKYVICGKAVKWMMP